MNWFGCLQFQHPVVGDRFAIGEAAALPRSCRSAGLGKSKLMICCVGVEIGGSVLPALSRDGDSLRVERTSSLETFSARYWGRIEREGFMCWREDKVGAAELAEGWEMEAK